MLAYKDDNMTDAEVVSKVEQYIRENDYCSVEKACAFLMIPVDKYWKARWRRLEETEKMLEEIEKLLKEQKDEEYHKALTMLEALRLFLDEEREEERERREQDDWDLSM